MQRVRGLDSPSRKALHTALKGLIRVPSLCHPEIIGHTAALEAQSSLTTEHAERITWLVWPILYLCQPRFATLAKHLPRTCYALSIEDDTPGVWNAKPTPVVLLQVIS
jgi:hypothetical protein